jgi:hypothetical protein
MLAYAVLLFEQGLAEMVPAQGCGVVFPLLHRWWLLHGASTSVPRH